MAWLCVDAGTSIIKAVVFADDGRELAISRCSVAVLCPQQGFAEQDMEKVWQAVLDTCRNAVSRAGVQIHGIATTAQGDGMWPVDAAGRPVHPAVLWNDARAASIVDGWLGTGVLEQAAKISGSISYPGLPNSIWQWFAAQHPEILSSATASLTCNGWIFLRLTGEVVADLSDASNPFCDVQARTYSPELLRLFGLEQLAHLLPRLENEDAPVAGLLREPAESIGVAAGIPVVMAPYDIVATAHGAGCIETGDACVILGTTVCAEVISDAFQMPGCGTTIALEQTNRFLHAMPTLTGCEALTWAAAVFGVASVQDVERLAAAAPPAADGPLFLPYLSPAGERSPFLNPHAQGNWSSLSLRHDRTHMARSIYEGLSYAVRDCLATAGLQRPAEVRVCGGGARSSFWCQMIADVTGHTVLRPCVEEPGARGAFLHGRVRSGEARTLQCAHSVSPISADNFAPRHELRESYDIGFARFLEARTNAALLWTPPRHGGGR